MEPAELRESIERLVAQGAFADAEELAANGWRVWLTTGDLDGGRAALAALLDREAAEPSRDRAVALYADGVLAFRQGDEAGSLARSEEARDAARAAGDAPAESLALVGLCRVALRDGRYGDVVELAREARRLVGDDEDAQAGPLHLEAAGTRLGGDYEAARALYLESLDLSRRRGNAYGEAMELHNLGHVSLRLGDVGAAEGYFARWRELTASSHSPYDRGMAALNEAALAAAHGERERGADRLARAEATLAAAGIVLDPDDASEAERLRALLG
jgi:tetratricopeptide (TPR) repeat protein